MNKSRKQCPKCGRRTYVRSKGHRGAYCTDPRCQFRLMNPDEPLPLSPSALKSVEESK